MTIFARAIALGASVVFGALAAHPADAAPKKAPEAEPRAPAETTPVDDRAEMIRVATGHYDVRPATPKAKAKTAPMPVPRPEPVRPDPSDPLEILAIASGAYDARRTAPAGGTPSKPPSATVDAAAARGVDLANPYRDLVERYSSLHGLPPALADAVMKIESGYNPQAYNAGAIGLMQILLPTARGLGYDGDAQGLTHPETNLKYGILYLAQAYRLSNGDTCQTVMRYQSGHYASRPNAANIAYCEKARTILARAG